MLLFFLLMQNCDFYILLGQLTCQKYEQSVLSYFLSCCFFRLNDNAITTNAATSHISIPPSLQIPKPATTNIIIYKDKYFLITIEK